ncbi:MAG: 50S ribosomal protein L7ae [Clostridia bacterium]|nr:50S ribosomal protein L7ae [Clostridia bacterium]
MDKNLLPTLGLARRAGKLLLGVASIQSYPRSVELLIIASDASPRVTRALAGRKESSVVSELTKVELGHAVGCKQTAVIAVTDAGFAGAIRKKMELQEENV